MLQHLARSSSSSPPVGLVLLAFAAVIMLPVVASACLALLALEQNSRLHRLKSFEQIASEIADDIDSALARMEEKLQVLAASPAIAEADYARFYEQAKAAAPRLEGGHLVLVDYAMEPAVNTLVPWGAPLPPLEHDEMAEKALASGRPMISPLLTAAEQTMGPGASVWLFQVAVPSPATDSVRHVLLAFPSVAHLLAILEPNLPPRWGARIVDERGLVMARVWPFAGDAPLMRTSRGLTLAAWRMELAQADEGGSVLPWLWIVGGAAALLLAIALAWLLARRLTEPMERAARAAEMVGRGQFPPLARSTFAEANSVIAALGRASAQVAQRTRALKKARDEARRRAREAEDARDEAGRRAREAEEARALLHTLLENVPDGITIVGGPPDFATVASSRTAREQLGGLERTLLPLASDSTSPGLGLYRPESSRPAGPEEYPLYRACHHGETVRDEEWVVVRPDGRRIICAMDVVPIRDRAGALIGAVNCWRDITQRTKSEAKLREASALASAVGAATQALIYVKDASGRFTSANPATLQVIGREERDVLGKTHVELLGETPEAHAIAVNDRRVILSGETIEVEERASWEGITRDYLSSKSPVFGARGEVVALVGVSVDITDRKRSESAAQLLAAVDQDLALLSDPHAIIGHAVNRLGAFLAVSRCHLAILGEDGESLTIEPGWLDGAASLEGTHSMAVVMTPELRAAMDGPDAFAVDDVRTDVRTAARAEHYLEAEIAAFIVRPIAEGGQVRAYLAVHAREPRAWRPDELRLVHEVATRVWAARSRALAEAALRTSEERYRFAAQAIQGMIYDWDFTTGQVERSAGLEALLGYRPEDAPSTIDWWRSRCHPDDLEQTSAVLDTAVSEHRTHCVVQYRIRHRDGYWVHVADRGHILYDCAGKPLRQVGSTVDITGQVHAETRLRESEERFRALVEASAQTVWTMNASGEVDEDSPSWRAFTGQTLLQFLGWGWLDALHPQDRARVAESWRHAVAGERPSSIEYRLRHRTGEWRWTQARAVPLLAPDGAVRSWVAMTTDITDRKKWEEQQKLLLSELSHRVKNVLAVVQAMATRTLSGGRSLAEASDVLIKRLHALSRAHDMLTTRDWQGAPLRAIVQGEFTPFAGRTRIDGPDLVIGPRMAQTLALVLHELATNAVKYGALSNDNGQVAVKWRVEGEGESARFKFEWRETGGPTVGPPARRGFGTALLNMAVAGNPDASSPIRFEPQGLVYEIDVPLASMT